jgi:hypothetical protein
VNHHDHPRDAVIKAQHRAEEHLEALPGAVAKLCQEPSVVLEVDPQHFGNAKDKLSMWDGIKDVVGDVFPELNTPLNPPSRGD